LTVRFDFAGRRVLVTGGSNGLGRAIAQAFAASGAAVTVTGRRRSSSDYDHDLSAFEYRQVDMADPAGVAALAGSLDRLDVLVNNAGQNLAIENEWDPDVFDRVLAVNLGGVFRLSALCKPLLRASDLPGGASVVNVGSLTGDTAVSFLPGYGASKAAVVQLTKTLAVAWAKHGIRANAVIPGLIETNMTGPLDPESSGGPHLARTPLRRLGVPGDVAPTVLFLSSASAAYITGESVRIDGGWAVQG
jgi:NAD(P)-dependent dehydrogenase (short-subunit alcohol dehydrogenase family)